MARYEAIGSVKGCKIFWKRETGEIYIRKPGFISSTEIKLQRRAYTIAAAFALTEDHLSRR